MRSLNTRGLRVAALGAALVACSADSIVAPELAPQLTPGRPSFVVLPTDPTGIRVSEFHYDNSGADSLEAIEVSGPVGASLANYKLVAYNGANALAAVQYDSKTLSGTIPATPSCGSRGVLVFPYVGLQNGTSDGFALVDPAGQVIELLSYEGSFKVVPVGTANAGPAAGLTATDVGVSEPGTEDSTTIKRIYNSATHTFSWVKSKPTNMGRCTDDNSTVAQPAVALVVNQGAIDVMVGKTATLTATATDAGGNDVTASSGITWSTGDASIATVDQATGVVTGVTAGSVTITAKTANNLTATATVNVLPQPVVTTIALTPDNTTIFTGANQQYTAVARDKDGADITATTSLTWTSSDVAVATVSAAGLAKGIAVGTVTITVTSTNGTTAAATLKIVDPPSAQLPDVRFSEIHYDNSGTDVNEKIEVEAPLNTSLAGYSIVLYDGGTSSTTGLTGAAYNTTAITGTLTGSCNGRGVVVVNFAQIQNGSPDGFALVDPSGHVVEFLSYEGTFTAFDGPAANTVSTDIGVEEGSGTSANQSLSRQPNGRWSAPANNTFGLPNACANGAGNTPSLSIATSGPDTLVIGWQRRGFVTYYDANGNSAPLPGSITWTTETPSIVSVDALGYATALAPGDGIVRATVGTGATLATGTYHVQAITYEPVKATYRNHIEFGTPTSATDPHLNDIVLTKPGYVTSYNSSRGGPNWVSWNINATTFGNAERCECFSSDAALPADAVKITDQDYVNGGYDRGHMVQSESRTSTASENAATFLLTNILPQAANNNQGPWSGFENYTNDFARVNGKDVYVIAGGEFAATPTTLKNAGRVAIPDYTWKVAVVVSSGVRVQDIKSLNDLQVLAIRIPNLLSTAPAKNDNWQPWVTTVDDIQKRTGLDLLSALPDNIERAVETNDRAPVASFTAPASAAEGASVAFDGSASSDPDVGDQVSSYTWSFGDGTTATGATATHSYADNGSYTVTLTVTDKVGIESSATRTVSVSNVAPTASFGVPATAVVEGSSFTLALTGVVDPGTADTFTYEFDCGAGWVVSASPSIACPVSDNGAPIAVHARITDDDGGTNSYDGTVSTVNAAPTATLVAPASVVEGSAIEISLANATDASPVDQASLSFAFACSATESWQSSATASFSCPTTDNGTVTVRAKVSDKDGGFNEYSQAVQVSNAAPVIASFTAPTGPVAARTAVTAALTYTDVGTADTHTATFAWGDGTTSTVNGAAGQVTGTHSYASAGFYIVSVTLSDDDGGTATATSTSTLTVFDAAAGGVKAQGWFAGPNGGQGSDKIHFDLDAAYANGGQPTGALTFDWSGVKVDGSSFEWLVVKGSTAFVRGSGRATDGSTIDFVVSVTEGSTPGNNGDRIRLKAWNRATGAVLYDTNAGADLLAAPTVILGGGNVKVGRK